MLRLYELQRSLKKLRIEEQSYEDAETSTILPRDDVDGQAQRDT